MLTNGPIAGLPTQSVSQDTCDDDGVQETPFHGARNVLWQRPGFSGVPSNFTKREFAVRKQEAWRGGLFSNPAQSWVLWGPAISSALSIRSVVLLFFFPTMWTSLTSLCKQCLVAFPSLDPSL